MLFYIFNVFLVAYGDIFSVLEKALGYTYHPPVRNLFKLLAVISANDIVIFLHVYYSVKDKLSAGTAIKRKVVFFKSSSYGNYLHRILFSSSIGSILSPFMGDIIKPCLSSILSILFASIITL